MSEGVRIDIGADSSDLDRAIQKIQQLDTALQRVSADKVTKELTYLAKQAEVINAKTGKSVDDLVKTLQRVEAQAKSTAGQYAAAFGHLGPEISKATNQVRHMSNMLKDANKVLDTVYKTSEQYRHTLQEQTKVLSSNTAQLTANNEAAKRTVENNNRLRAELKQLSTEEGKQTSVLKAKLSAEQALQKAQAESLTINERQQAQAQILRNRLAELNTAIGQSNLILKEQIKGQERQITFSARQANAASELAQRLRYLNTEEGKNSVVLREKVKHKEMLAGLEIKRRNELANLRREVAYLSTEEGKQTAILKERAKYKQQVAALEEKRSNTLKLLRKELAYLNTEEAKTAATRKENIKHKTEMLAAEARRANSLKSLTAELEYVQSAEGRKAARTRENIKHEQEMAASETKRLNTLTRLRADLAAMESTTGRAIAQTQQQIRIQKELDAAEAKRVATIAQLKAASSDAAQTQQREIELLRRKNELSQREMQLDARRSTLAQEQTVRLREINNQIAAVQTSTGRMIATKERELQIIRRLQSENRLYAQSLVGIQVNLEKVRLAKEAANQATAGFRAGIMGAGASFGIFTSSTILTATAVYSVVRAFRTSIAAGVEFEAQLDRVNAVMDRTGVNSAALAAKVRSLAEQTVFTANEVGQGMLYLGMAGMATNDALVAIEPSLRLASIGMLDMGTTADIVTNILFGFGLQASELELLVDRMAHAITDSNMDIQQLGNAMSYVAPLAREADMSIEELVASLQVLHNTGIKASRAGTAMRTTILSLMAPTEKAMAVLRKYDIAVDDHNGRMRNWTELLKELADAQLSLGEVENLVGKRQAAAFKAMIDSASATRQWKNEIQQADPALANINTQLDYYIDRLQRSKGTAEEMQATLEDNLRGDWMKLVSAVQEKYIDFFNQHRDGYRAMVQDVTEFIRSLDMDTIQAWFNKIIEGLTKVLQVIAAVKAASMGFSFGAAAGTVIGGGVGGAIGMLGGPAGVMAGAAAGGSIGAKIGTAVGGTAAGATAGIYAYNKAGDIRDSILGIFEDAEDAIDAGVRNATRRYEESSTQQLRLIREQRTAALAEAETLLLTAQEGLAKAVENGTQGAIDSFQTQVRSILDTIGELNDTVAGIDRNLASRGQIVGSLEDLKTIYEGYQSQVVAMVSSYNNLPENMRPALADFQKGLQEINDRAEEAKRQYHEALNARTSSEELKNQAREEDRNRSLEAIENGKREIDVIMGRVSAQAQLNEAYAERRKLDQELKSQFITLEDGSEVPRSANMTEDIMARKVKNAEKIVRLERQVTAENERQVQAAQRLTERQANAALAAEKSLVASRKQLREALSFNEAVEHRNRMFERGYLLLDDQDYQFVRQIEHQEEILELLQTELVIRSAAKDSTQQELDLLEENISVQKAVLEAIQAQRQARLENVNLESEAYRMAVLHKNALDQMYSTIESSTVRLMESGFRDTKSFFDSIVAQFKRMLAELAYQAAIKPIVVNMVAGVGSAFFGQQAAKSFAAGQGVTLGGAGGSAMSLGQMASAGWSFLQSGAQSSSLSAMGSSIAKSGIGQKVGLSYVVPGTEGYIMNTAAGNFLQTGLGYSPWGIVGSLGANLLGFQGSGNMVVDTVLQTGGSIAGGAIGAKIGSLGGPIGAIAGAIGGTLLAGLFGGGNKSYRTRGSMGTTSTDRGAKWLGPNARNGEEIRGQSAFGWNHLHINKYGKVSDYQPIMDAWIQLDNTIAAANPDKIKEVTAALDGFRRGGGRGDQAKLGAEFLNERMEIVYKTIDEAMYGFSKQLILGVENNLKDLDANDMGATFLGLRRLRKDVENNLKDLDAKDMASAFLGLQRLSKDFEITAELVVDLKENILVQFQELDEGIGFTLSRVATNFAIVQAVLESFGAGLEGTVQHVFALSNNLVEYAGGLEKFTTAAASYYDIFYSEEEKFANFMKTFNTELNRLGIALPETAGAFRAAVDWMLEDSRDLHGAYDMMSISAEAAKYYQQLENWVLGLGQTYMDFLGRLPTNTELNYWVDALKSGAVTFTQAVEMMTASIRGSQVTLTNDQITDLQAAALEIYDAYTYSLDVIKQEHDLRIARIRAEHNLYDTVKRLIDNLKLSSVSPLTPAERLAEARSQYESILAQVQSGDLSQAGNLQSASQAYLQETSQFYASNDLYIAIFNNVLFQLEDLGQQYEQTLTVEERIEQANLDLIKVQENARTILQDQLTELARNTDVNLGLLQLMQFLPADLAQALNAVLPWDQILASQNNGQMDWGIDPRILELYRTGLGRDPDWEGGQYWQSYLNSGAAIDQIADSFKQSPEYQIQDLYRTLLGRDADEGGMSWYMNSFNNGQSLLDIANSIKQSEEYRHRHGTHRAGLDYVPFDGYVAELHKGEQVIPANARRSNDATESLVAEVKALRAEVAKLRSDQRENTQAVVRSNYDANNQAAAAVGKSVERAAESSRTIHDKVTLR